MRHLWVTGPRDSDRRQHIAQLRPDGVVVSTHRNIRGPYTGVDTALRRLLPVAVDRWPDLVERHRVELLHGMPYLAEIIGPPPATIANSSPYEQRTRFFHAGMIRPVSNGIVTFMLRHADRLVESGEAPPCLVFDDVTDTEPTTAEFLALLIRRAAPDRLRLVLAGRPGRLPDELAVAVARHADAAEAPALPDSKDTGTRSAAELVRAYVNADCTSTDPEQVAAYAAADPDLVGRLHDQRAADLETSPTPRVPVGAIPLHRERGSDPAGAGRAALLAALRYCVQIGFSAAIVDIGERGRAVADPAAHPRDYCDFTMQTAYATVDLGNPQHGLELCMELRTRYTDPKIHALTSYTIAMLHTRFFTPRDHETAVAWQNNAVALAHLLPDPDERRLQIGFQDNALALVEMHRGKLDTALALVQAGIDRLDRELDRDQWVMHRTQLVHNRARLLTALGRLDEALRDYAVLVELDPYYTEYLTDRAKIARRRGDLRRALADYDRGIDLAPPFPELYYNRGTARLEHGDTDGALADFSTVLDLEPGETDSRIAAIEILMDRGDLDAAQAHLAAGLTYAPADAQLLCAQGTITLERGHPAEAIRWFDDALCTDTGYPAALINRATARFHLGRPADAVDDLTRALELTGDHPDVLYNRALAYSAADKTHDALTDLQRAARLAPDNPDIRAELELRHRHLSAARTRA
jgi:tetratricopeptide (TPR) repeat protein